HPDSRREMRAARYLNWRINRRVSLEDKALIERVQSGMGSSSYTMGPLSEGEVCLRSFARRMRGLIPESRLPRAPERGWSRE
ncbi:MAG: aromatic ring-hydroxylating dioxygenase subunit alpha, partial [Gammaproteobacteria bacterium]